MNTKAYVLATAAIVSGISSTVAWRALVNLRTAEAERNSLELQRTTSETQLARLESDALEAERARVEVEHALAEARARKETAERQSAKPGGPTAKPVAPDGKNANVADFFINDPKLHSLSVASQRARFDTTYGAFFYLKQLSPAQVEKLRSARARFDELQQDVMVVMREQKLRRDDPALVTMGRQAQEELRAAQLEILGPEGLDQLHEYERTLPALGIAQRFAGAMAVADLPLSHAQAQQLTQILVDASSSSGRERNLDPAGIDWSVVDRRAAGVLSEAQLAQFKRIEPIGGGASRWIAQLERAMRDARETIGQGRPRG